MSFYSDEYAVYLPAVNTVYADAVVNPPATGRPYPTSFSLEDLEFWNGKSQLWNHPFFLHSAGQYRVGTRPDNAVTRRPHNQGTLFGDSGGFQIGTGKLQGIRGLKGQMSASDACTTWRQATQARTWILGWLETHTNYAMTMDMPLWARTPKYKDTPFHQCSESELTQLTVENLQFIDNHRRDRTKWLNVIQGSDFNTIARWWNAVKWFPCSGYALSSSAGKAAGLHAVLGPLLMMRDDHAFDPGRNWLHMLGVSTAPWAVILTAIQKAMRSTVNPDFGISFDSSSPFQDASKFESYEVMPTFGAFAKDWAIKKVKIPQSIRHYKSQAPLPFSSPIADLLTLGDLNVNGEKYRRNRLDRLSHTFVAHHNIWTYLEAFKRANELMFDGSGAPVPKLYRDCVEMIDYAFKVENWQTLLEKEAKLLTGFKG